MLNRPLKAGDRLYNNDPRIPETDPRKIITVLHAGIWRIKYHTGYRTAWVKINRVFQDGKNRAQGYNLLSGIVVAGAEIFAA